MLSFFLVIADIYHRRHLGCVENKTLIRFIYMKITDVYHAVDT